MYCIARKKDAPKPVRIDLRPFIESITQLGTAMIDAARKVTKASTEVSTRLIEYQKLKDRNCKSSGCKSDRQDGKYCPFHKGTGKI